MNIKLCISSQQISGQDLNKVAEYISPKQLFFFKKHVSSSYCSDDIDPKNLRTYFKKSFCDVSPKCYSNFMKVKMK